MGSQLVSRLWLEGTNGVRYRTLAAIDGQNCSVALIFIMLNDSRQISPRSGAAPSLFPISVNRRLCSG
jgi:hypothetical protein